MNLLVDECLHTSLVEVAVEFGHEAPHVNCRPQRRSGLEPHAADPRGRVHLRHQHAKDFRKLYAREEIHAGLIILIPNAPPDEQRILFAAALQDLELEDGLVNEAIEVAVVDGEIEIVRYDLPREEGA